MSTITDDMKLNRLYEASEWLLRLEDSARTEQDIIDWLRWCDVDSENLAAFEALQRDWQDLGALDPTSVATEIAATRTTVQRTRTVKVAWALAASLAAVALTVVLKREPFSTPSPAPYPLAAAVSNRAATLPDGSKVILSTQTRVEVDFTGGKRRLDLSAGQAYFDVQSDKTRPFVVHAGDVSVTAVGTAFDVRRDERHVTVIVAEGAVELTSPSDPARPTTTWRVEAGYQLMYSLREHTAAIDSVDPATAFAWYDGELAYVREPLGSVIEDLNRHSTRKIVLADAKIAELRFTGTVFAAGLDDWLKAIQQVYPVTVQPTASGDILLSSETNVAQQ